MVLTDTDSYYVQFATSTPEEALKEHLRDEYYHRIYDFCQDQRHPRAFLPRKCCDYHNKVDNKFPALFKVEVIAELVVALCSKTYVCRSADKQNKLSAKGGNKKTIMQSKTNPVSRLRQVLRTQKPNCVTNRGFKVGGGKVQTYETTKEVFPFFYIKRQVLANTYHTKAYEDLVLNPVPKTYICLVTDMTYLSADFAWPCKFKYLGHRMQTIRQALCYGKLRYVQAMVSAELRGEEMEVEEVGDGRRRKRRRREQERIIPTLDQIRSTTHAGTLVGMMRGMGACITFDKDLYSIVYAIVESFMNKYSQAKWTALLKSENEMILNCCHLDPLLGNGSSPSVTRWNRKAVQQGGNYLGKVYMNMRCVRRRQMGEEA